MKHILNRKGFTLVEISTVMAVAIIVAVMITSTVLISSKQKDDIQSEASFIAEVTDVQIKITSWINKYDNVNSTLTVIESTGADGNPVYSLKAVKTLDDNKTETETLSFSDSALTANETPLTSQYKNIKGLSFEILEESEEEYVIKKVLKVTITSGNNTGSDKQMQKLLFPLFSGKTRERNVTGKSSS